MITHMTHLFVLVESMTYSATRNGSAQIWPNKEVKDSLPVRSESQVMPSMVKICRTWEGMTRRLVVNVSKPRARRDSVR